ncbi:glycosyltransferase [Mucilaginibacter antarcticus]|uniref:Glycosyltransferase n=3 Tax=Mucilaginibacter antarcticus TaxID=1855725 RepID=A0ABW5XJT9_9SPHI
MTEGGKRLTGGNNTSPKITIITVVLNAAALLPGYLENVTRFLSDDIELVILDGASTDGTIDLLKQHPNSISYWASKPDGGIYDAMNQAVKYARGQWVYFLGVDDTLLEDFKDVPALLNNASTVYYANVVYYGQPFYKVYDDYYLTKLNFIHQALFYPKGVFESYQYDTQYKVYADYHLNLRLWKDTAYQFEHLDKLMASFSEGGFSSTVKDQLFESQRDQLFKQYLKPASYYRYLNRTIGLLGALKRFILNK